MIRWIVDGFHQLKVKHKLLGIYLIVTAIPVLFVGAYVNYGMRDVVLNHTLSEAESNVDKLEMRMQSICNRMTNISDQIYLNRDLKELLARDYDTALEVYNAYHQYPVFSDYLNYYDEIANIRFFMTKEMITDSHFIHADRAVRNKNWYQEAMAKKGKISWVYMQDYWTNEHYLALTRAVYGQSKQLMGVLAIYVSPEKLRAVTEGEPYRSFITLDDRTIVHSQEETRMGETPQFLTRETEGYDQYITDHQLNGKDVKVRVHSFQPEQSLDNDIQIATIIPIEDVMRDSNQIFSRGFFVITGALSLSLVFFVFFIKSFHHRIEQLRQSMVQVAQGDFHMKKNMKGRDEISQVYQDLLTTSESLQKMIEEVYIHQIKEEKWKRKQKEMDFKMLASQINPHFLYNTLEMIRMKAILQQDREVADIVKRLSKMMRSALERTDRPIPLQQEIALIQNYLEIQKLRFGDTFHYSIEVDDAYQNYALYPLLIQPIVENAIIHGLEEKEGEGFIKIKVVEESDHLVIAVIDNGIGLSRSQLAQVKNQLHKDYHQSNDQRIGLHNVHQRIQLTYGNRFGLKVDSIQGVGTVMRLYLPASVDRRGKSC
ncbi:two-component system sensor kinase [Gracilibacillus halophilus YIM-C55.5]|uniref:Two-component system sensor kinase n=1 Tax=Gracilibacillus halophilus YIM-C55.5 TaxID=1308866 RepID=N4WNW9_9BACI|nr:sensor histidine kinase [Gracilibacillus halophilus]ENH97842.1 two-component system sensor kinase [Gracilibacillus halophilus YIM-C55.5]